MQTTMESIKQMVDVNTVVGDAFEMQDGSVIVPVSRVAFGFAAGGGEMGKKSYGVAGDGAEGESATYPFAGGSGAGVAVSPVGFLVVSQGKVQLLSVETASVDKLIELAPALVDKVQGMVKRGDRPPN